MHIRAYAYQVTCYGYCLRLICALAALEVIYIELAAVGATCEESAHVRARRKQRTCSVLREQARLFMYEYTCLQRRSVWFGEQASENTQKRRLSGRSASGVCSSHASGEELEARASGNM